MSTLCVRFQPCSNNRLSFTGIHLGVDFCALLLVVSCFVPSAALAADPAAAPDVRANVNEVQLEMVATDTAGRPVSNLAAADLKVVEDGSPVSHFGLNSAQDLPLFATVIYDVSESNQKCWRQMEKQVMRFVQSTIGKQDQLWIAAFDSKLQFKSQIEESDQLRQALHVKGDNDNVTAFNDSLLGMLRDHPSSEAQPRRAAMIVFSDGEDNYSMHSPGEVIAAAQQAKVAVYTIRRTNNHGWGNGGGVLHAIAVGTGGRDFTVANTRELERALATIGNELRSGYVLYYPARPDRSGNGFRSVSVKPNRNKHIRIQVQNAYYIPVDRQGGAQ
jgi:VWFA-related protein